MQYAERRCDCIHLLVSWSECTYPSIMSHVHIYHSAEYSVASTRKDVVLPLLNPIPGNLTKDGQPINKIHLKNNTKITLSIVSANRSKAIWGDDAEEWKPQRGLARERFDLNQLCWSDIRQGES